MQVVRLSIACLVGIFCLLSWLLPNHYQPWVTAYQSFVSFVALLAAILYFSLPGNKLFSNRVFLFFLLLALVPICQFVLGDIFFLGDAIVICLFIVGVYFSLNIGYSLKPSEFEFFLVVILLGAMISVWIALNQWTLIGGSIWLADLRPGARPFANFAQPNNFSTFLGFALVATIYLRLAERITLFTSCLLIAFLSFGAALAQSKTMILALMVLAFVLILQSKSKERKVLLNNLILFSSLYLLFLWLAPYFSGFLDLPADSIAERDESAASRLKIWSQMGLAVLERPWIGYGWSQVSYAQVMVSDSHPIPMLIGSSHNLLLDLFIWVGVPLGILIAVYLAVLVLFPILKRKDSLALFGVCGFVFFGVHALTEFPYEYSFLLFPASVFLGVGLRGTWPKREFVFPSKVSLTTTLASVLLFSFVFKEYVYLENSFRETRFESAKFSWRGARIEQQEIGALTQLEAFNYVAKNRPKDQMSDLELDLYRKVFLRFPYDAYRYRYIEALALNGKTEEAAWHLQLLRKSRGDDVFHQAKAELESLAVSSPEVGLLLNQINQSKMSDEN